MLPTGKTTTSPKKYTDAWRKLAAPFERILDAHLFLFDPGITLSTDSGREIDFDLWVTLKLYRAIMGKDFTE